MEAKVALALPRKLLLHGAVVCKCLWSSASRDALDQEEVFRVFFFLPVSLPHLPSDTPSLYLKPPELTTIRQNKTEKELDRGGVDFISLKNKNKNNTCSW